MYRANPQYVDYIDRARYRVDEFRRDTRVVRYIDDYGYNWNLRYRPIVYDRYNSYYSYYVTYRDRYSDWYRYGFYGGFAYSFRPVFDISIYFYNPLVYWCYSYDRDDYYYSRWYGNDYDRYYELRQPFPYVGVYFPTDSFRDLLIGVGSMDVNRQLAFRGGFRSVTDILRTKLSQTLGTNVSFSSNDIVVTNFDLLRNDAIVFEGWVNYYNQYYPFKAFIDLNQPNQSIVFITNSQRYDASLDAARDLEMMNGRISQLGGNPYNYDDRGTNGNLPPQQQGGYVDPNAGTTPNPNGRYCYDQDGDGYCDSY